MKWGGRQGNGAVSLIENSALAELLLLNLCVQFKQVVVSSNRLSRTDRFCCHLQTRKNRRKNNNFVADQQLQKREAVFCRCTADFFYFFCRCKTASTAIPRLPGVFAATKSEIVAACTAYERHSKSHDPVPLQKSMSLATIPENTPPTPPQPASSSAPSSPHPYPQPPSTTPQPVSSTTPMFQFTATASKVVESCTAYGRQSHPITCVCTKGYRCMATT